MSSQAETEKKMAAGNKTEEKKTEKKKAAGKSGIKKITHPDKVLSYFKPEKKVLLLIAIGGTCFNVGMTAGPYFEGRLAQCLYDCIQGAATGKDMLSLAGIYLGVILFVQLMRALKRFSGARLRNDFSRNMRHMLYNGIVHMTREEVERESTGAIMTKAVADVDACAMGMQQVSTEIFDTGVLLASYFVMLLIYDWRLTLLACIFMPISYFLAASLKKPVTRVNERYKMTAGRLNQETLDRVNNAVTYRVYGREENRDASYEKILTEYEKNAVKANLWGNATTPIYNIVCMSGVLFIIWLGGRNVLESGWTVWDIGVFTTYVSCFTKLAQKASSSARFFNSIQRAQVSWQRIKPLFKEYVELPEPEEVPVECLEVRDAEISYPGYEPVLEHLNFTVKKGQIIGVTGAVACGKSALGKVFIGNALYEGSIRLDGTELKDLDDVEKSGRIAYMGHEPELMSDTVWENILLGKDADPEEYLKLVRMDEEIEKMPGKRQTYVGNGGQQLSGGQQARISLARTLCHRRGILVLDDPFSAVDKNTEREIFARLRVLAEDGMILLLSHRLALFPETDGVLFLKDGSGVFGTHEELLESNPGYRKLYETQQSEKKA